MKDVYLVFKNLTRNKLRLTLNGFAIFTAFFLFGLLGALKGAFEAGIELSADNRLIVVNKINFTQPLPEAYYNKVKSIEGVNLVSHANWFGAYYQDPKAFLVAFAVDPTSYLAVYPELQLSEQAKNAWMGNRQGMVVGEKLAANKGWKVGDRVPISSNIYLKEDGSHTWEMEISGIFTANDKKTDTNYLLFHYLNFKESITFGRNYIGWMVISTDAPELNAAVAKAVDSLFANSAYETETSTEKAFNKAFLEQFGSIGMIITSVLLAAFFTILLIVANTMVLAIRERTREIAVMKTLGYPAARIFRMVISESTLLAIFGGAVGMGLAYISVNALAAIPQIQNMFPSLVIGAADILMAIIYMLALGLITGLVPALRAMKLNTVEALSSNS